MANIYTIITNLLIRFVSPVPEPRRFWRTVLWWELRRIPYNLIMLVVGGVSFIIFLLAISNSGSLAPGEDAVEPMALFVALLVAPFIINIFYTVGWVVEGFLNLVWKRNPIRGPFLWMLGVMFSIFIISMPAWLWVWLLVIQYLHP